MKEGKRGIWGGYGVYLVTCLPKKLTSTALGYRVMLLLYGDLPVAWWIVNYFLYNNPALTSIPYLVFCILCFLSLLSPLPLPISFIYCLWKNSTTCTLILCFPFHIYPAFQCLPPGYPFIYLLPCLQKNINIKRNKHSKQKGRKLAVMKKGLTLSEAGKPESLQRNLKWDRKGVVSDYWQWKVLQHHPED